MFHASWRNLRKWSTFYHFYQYHEYFNLFGVVVHIMGFSSFNTHWSKSTLYFQRKGEMHIWWYLRTKYCGILQSYFPVKEIWMLSLDQTVRIMQNFQKKGYFLNQENQNMVYGCNLKMLLYLLKSCLFIYVWEHEPSLTDK